MQRPPSIRRFFRDWLAGPGAAVAPRIRIQRWTGRVLFLRFDIGHPFISATLRADGLTIVAQLRGRCWDFLLDLDVVPVQAEGEWHCELCMEPRPAFPTREALLRHHLFGPLAGWIEQKLSRAEALAFFGNKPCGMTWAELVLRDAPQCGIEARASALVSLRVETRDDAALAGKPG